MGRVLGGLPVRAARPPLRRHRRRLALWDGGRVRLEDLVRLRRARDLMDRDYAKPLDVPALARTAFLSPGHFWLFPCFRGSRGRLHTCVSDLIASAGIRAREGVGWRVRAAMSGARAGVGGRSSAAAVYGAAHQRTSWPRRSWRWRRGQRPGCYATTTTSSSTSYTMR